MCPYTHMCMYAMACEWRSEAGLWGQFAPSFTRMELKSPNWHQVFSEPPRQPWGLFQGPLFLTSWGISNRKWKVTGELQVCSWGWEFTTVVKGLPILGTLPKTAISYYADHCFKVMLARMSLMSTHCNIISRIWENMGLLFVLCIWVCACVWLSLCM